MLAVLGCAVTLASACDGGVSLFAPKEVVLFQGDSITDGNRGRNEDPNHILGHGYAFILAAKHGSRQMGEGITFINRGISGNNLADLEARWSQDTLNLKPSVLSILVGINDIDQARRAGKTLDLRDWEDRYSKLLTATKSAIPGVKLVLCEPFVLEVGDSAVYRARRQQADQASEIVRSLAHRFDAALVPLQQVFDEAAKKAPAKDWIWDGIHPTYAGHQLMAEAWEKACRLKFVSPLEDPERNSAIAPEINTERDSYNWTHRHRDVLDCQNKVKPEIVMIGDSITHFWGGEPNSPQKNGPRAWQNTFGQNAVLNMGFGWDRTQNVLWRLQHGELTGVSPKWIVLNIGTNNLVGDETARTNSAAEVAVGIRKIVELLNQRCPEAKILVMGVFPRGAEAVNELDGEIQKLNSILAQTLVKLPRTVFLDLRKELGLPSGGANPALFSDGTHPNEKGYELWGQALKKLGAV